MRKKSSLKGKLAVFLLFAALVITVVSFVKSDFLYTNYLRFYYLVVQEGEFDDYHNQAKVLFQQKDWEDFLDLTRNLSRVYPDRSEIRRLMAKYYFLQGDPHRAFIPALESLEYNASDEDILTLFIPALFRERMYQDLILIMNHYRPEQFRTMKNVPLYYGATLFEMRDYRKARRVLSLIPGHKAGHLYYYYMGRSCEEEAAGMTDNQRRAMLESALSHYRDGLQISSSDTDLFNGVIRVLKHLGRDTEAAALIGGRM
ncbi:MAG: hypothetical protein PF637_13885 [Spirochaetes bacterium]|nr:hypothetical protein [Spirochaetota bacterium]